VHIFFLIGFENRVLVLIQWAVSYLSYKRGARLTRAAGTAKRRPGLTPPIAVPVDRSG